MGSTSNQENEHVDCEIDGMICATQSMGHRKPWCWNVFETTQA